MCDLYRLLPGYMGVVNLSNKKPESKTLLAGTHSENNFKKYIIAETYDQIHASLPYNSSATLLTYCCHRDNTEALERFLDETLGAPNRPASAFLPAKGNEKNCFLN